MTTKKRENNEKPVTISEKDAVNDAQDVLIEAQQLLRKHQQENIQSFMDSYQKLCQKHDLEIFGIVKAEWNVDGNTRHFAELIVRERQRERQA